MSTSNRKSRSSFGIGKAAALLASAGLPLMMGCETDSFINPSITGRWEKTPTIVPILDKLSVVEDRSGDFVEYVEPTPEDLLPGIEPYRLGPGDSIEITLWDDIQRNQPNNYQRTVDSRGFVDLPQLGQVYLNGMTVDQSRDALAEALSRLVTEPIVAVNVLSPRSQTFTIIGAVETPGPYLVPKSDYQLLEALSAAGRFAEFSTEYVYIVRQVPLSDKVTNHGIKAPANLNTPATFPGTQPAPTTPGTPTAPPKPTSSGEGLINMIDKLSQPADEAKPADGTPAPTGTPPDAAPTTPPATPPATPPGGQPPIDLPDGPAAPPAKPDAPKPSFAVMGSGSSGMPTRTRAARMDDPPPVDLPDSQARPATATTQPTGGNNWIFLNGQWVQVSRPPSPAGTAGAETEQLMTQRVIRVALKPLMNGDTKSNIIIRPGDVLRIPAIIDGVVYVDGQVQRPGVYNLPASGKITLSQVITAAGGFGDLAIPERTDVIRRLGDNRQAIIRIDLRAINEGTQPDVFLKPDDRINVGTNFWAYPLAVIRNGFRASYGFGFIIDRNFGNDIFGAPPSNINGE